jgi:rhamnulokinase
MKEGALCWNLEELFRNIKLGLKKCSELGKIPVSVGIDTWGVDFVLLDENHQMLGNSVGYRDKRTDGMDKLVSDVLSEEELYSRTGIQKQIFNTIYQLMAIKQNEPQLLTKAKKMLLLPDYFHYLLTGVAKNEYTNATTTQLVNAKTKQWDHELIKKLGYPEDLFGELVEPGSSLGYFTKAIQEELGFNCEVIVPATHDTGSAVVAVPSNSEDAVFISSGTWSLMGTERSEADCSIDSQSHNFTNEGGYNYRFRYLKNIMGLWMIQSIKKELNYELGYAELCKQAAKETIASIIPCNDSRFLAPESMVSEVKDACRESGQEVPETISQIAAVIYQSLAYCYHQTIGEIEDILGKKYSQVHIVGGGSNADYLNQLTAQVTMKTIIAGPMEATAIGNLAVQMIAKGMLGSLQEARDCIRQSFEVKEF